MENINLKELLTYNQGRLAQCEKELKYLTHPKEYGCMLTNCPWIVINKERFMCVCVDKENKTNVEFYPMYPTHFSRKTANEIISNYVMTDISGNRIPLEAIGNLEYYQMLRDWLVRSISSIENLMRMQEHTESQL